MGERTQLFCRKDKAPEYLSPCPGIQTETSFSFCIQGRNTCPMPHCSLDDSRAPAYDLFPLPHIRGRMILFREHSMELLLGVGWLWFGPCLRHPSRLWPSLQGRDCRRQPQDLV